MSVTDNLRAVLAELSRNADYLDDRQLDAAVRLLADARHIFLAGAGRSGVAIRGFANRLMHLGRSVSLVGDLTSPHTGAGDVLVIGSGSGETGSLVALANKAVAAGVRIIAITMDDSSTIAALATVTVVLPGVSPKLRTATGITSIQPMGSAFEQICFLTYDAIILELMTVLGESGDTMFERHADLE